jgi:hypothetical protein
MKENKEPIFTKDHFVDSSDQVVGMAKTKNTRKS